MCTRCGERERQSVLGLCRRCERETGDGRTIKEREAEDVARQQLKLAKASRLGPPGPLVFREVTIDGVCYEVRLDGAIQRELSDGRAYEDVPDGRITY